MDLGTHGGEPGVSERNGDGGETGPFRLTADEMNEWSPPDA